MTAKREGTKASQGARNHQFFVVLRPENARERDHVATRPTKTTASLFFLISEGIFNLPEVNAYSSIAAPHLEASPVTPPVFSSIPGNTCRQSD